VFPASFESQEVSDVVGSKRRVTEYIRRALDPRLTLESAVKEGTREIWEGTLGSKDVVIKVIKIETDSVAYAESKQVRFAYRPKPLYRIDRYLLGFFLGDDRPKLLITRKSIARLRSFYPCQVWTYRSQARTHR
jgi:hypothetical protein